MRIAWTSNIVILVCACSQNILCLIKVPCTLIDMIQPGAQQEQWLEVAYWLEFCTLENLNCHVKLAVCSDGCKESPPVLCEKCPEMTSVVILRYIKKTDLTWTKLTLVLHGDRKHSQPTERGRNEGNHATGGLHMLMCTCSLCIYYFVSQCKTF